MSEITITNGNFKEEVLDSKEPVLVDFWAPWCGPCKMLAPFVESTAKKFEGKAKVGKINVDEEPALAMQFGVSGIPTLLVFKDGKEVNRSVGYIQENEIADLLASAGV